MGCPGWKSCCWRIWGKCVGCPGWNSCCFRIKNPICVVANAACKVLRAVAYVALELAKKIVDGVSKTLYVAKAALKLAEQIVDKSRWTLTVSKGVLKGVQYTVHGALEAAKWIVRFALGGIIRIRKIEFDIKIGLLSEGHFKGMLELSILSKAFVKISFNLRLKSIGDMVEDLVKLVLSAFGGRRRREVSDRMKRAFPDFSWKHYFPKIYRPGSNRPSNTGETSLAATNEKPQFRLSADRINSAISSKSDKASNTRRNSNTGNDHPSHADTEVVERSFRSATNDNRIVEYTPKSQSLLLAAKQEEERYEHLLSQVDFVDNQESLGPVPDMVVSEARHLRILANASKEYVPRVDKSQGTGGRLPDITGCLAKRKTTHTRK